MTGNVIPRRNPAHLEIPPWQAVFTRQATITSWDVQPSAWIYGTETFASSANLTITNAGAGGTTVSGGQATMNGGGTGGSTRVSSTAITAPNFPQVFASLDVVSASGSSLGSIDIGFRDGSGNEWYANVAFGGIPLAWLASTPAVSQSNNSTPSTPFSIAVSIAGNSLCCWGDTGSGWVPKASVVTNGNATVDWTTVTPFIRATNWTFVVDNWKIGRVGAVAARDPAWVTWEDGSPLTDGSGNYLLMLTSQNGLVGAPYGSPDARYSYCGIWTVNPATFAIALNGIIFAGRDGGAWGDVAGKLIKQFDGTYRLALSSWGNGNLVAGDLYVEMGTTSTDITTGIHTVAVSPLTLPNIPVSPDSGAYDLDMIRLDGATWYGMHSIASPKTLASGYYSQMISTPDWSTFTTLATLTGFNPSEGNRLLPVNGQIWGIGVAQGTQLTWPFSGLSSGPSSRTVPCFPPLDNVAGDNGPWVSIMPYNDKWIMATFDDTNYAGMNGMVGNVWFYTAPRFQFGP